MNASTPCPPAALDSSARRWATLASTAAAGAPAVAVWDMPADAWVGRRRRWACAAGGGGGAAGL